MMDSSKLLVIVLIHLLIPSLYAQISIVGTVRDKGTGEPVPYAHISIAGTNSGTVANAGGSFRIVTDQLPVNIKASCIGYAASELEVAAAKNMVVYLEQAAGELEGVTVVAVGHARRLVEAAIDAIPKNYPTKPEMLTLFTRQGAYVDSARNIPYYIIEAVLDAEKRGYTKEVKKASVRLVKGRRVESDHMDFLLVRFYGGPHLPHWGDLVISRAGPLNIQTVDKYKFEIVDTLAFDGRMLYKVEFWAFKGQAITGNLYITHDTYAIAKIELRANSSAHLTLLEELRSSLNEVDRRYSWYSTEYSQESDSLWRLKRIEYQTAFEQKKQRDLYLYDDCMVTAYKPLTDDIPYQEQFSFGDIFLYNTGEYDTAFWNNYSVVLPSQPEKDAFEANPGRSSGPTKGEKVYNTLSRFRQSIGISAVPSSVAVAGLSYNRGPFAVTKEPFASQYYEYGLQSCIAYELSPQLLVGIEGLSSFKTKRYLANWAKIAWEKSLTPAHLRPVYLNTSMLLGYVNHRYLIGNIDNPAGFEIGRKQFDSERVKVFTEKRGYNLVPAVSLSVEKSKRMRFFAEAGYSYFLHTKNGVFLQEDQLLFKKRAFVSASDPALSFESEHPNAINSQWIFNVGITLTY